MIRSIPAALAALALAGCASDGAPAGDTLSAPAAGPATRSDPYLWLEAIEDEGALDWVRAQNARTFEELEGDPRFAALYEEALQILNSDARIPYGDVHGEYVYNFWRDETHVRGLWRRSPLAGYVAGAPRWETLLDVDALDREEKQNWIYGGYTCLAPAFERCLINLSRGGTDASVWREFSVSARDFVAGGFELPEAKSSMAWVDDDAVLVATDFGDGMTDSGYPHTLKMWRRGTTLAQAETVFRVGAEDIGVFPLVYREDGEAYPMAVRAPTFFERDVRLLTADGPVALPLPSRADVQGMIDGRLIVTLDEAWSYAGQDYPQGALVALSLADFEVESVYVPAASEAINDVEVGKASVVVALLDNVIGKARRLRRDGGEWRVSDIDVPPNGAVAIGSVNDSGDDFMFSFESLTVPDSLYYVDADDGVRRVASLPAMYDADDVVVEQRFAISSDGTRVPYFVMGQRDVLARGNAPTVQYGYGGFQSAIVPRYYHDPSRPQHGALAGRLWVARGGILVLSNIRGGNEFGPAWHAAGLKGNRQLVFDDFFAIAEALVADGVTTPARLGAIGRSNGGLLMGAALTQRPDLYAAIDCGVPLLDMLRYHKLLAGASWMGEYGNPDIAEERAFIEAYSPYQKLRRDARYPRVFFYTSTKDDRVHPGHARKMAARMAEYGHDFLYYENIEGGHGGTANQEQLARRTALEYMFFLRELGG